MLIRVTALGQPFAAGRAMDIPGCNQVRYSHIYRSITCCLADLFGVIILKTSGLAHGKDGCGM